MTELKMYFMENGLPNGQTDAVYLAEDVDILLLELVEKINALKVQLANKSWEGDVDRQGGSFTDEEIRESNEWK